MLRTRSFNALARFPNLYSSSSSSFSSSSLRFTAAVRSQARFSSSGAWAREDDKKKNQVPCIERFKSFDKTITPPVHSHLYPLKNQAEASVAGDKDSNQGQYQAPTQPDGGPEPNFQKVNFGYKKFLYDQPFDTYHGDSIPSYELAYETWGELNEDKSNAIILFTTYSASSHAASTADNPSPGWFENYIGPGKALDTDRFFIICCNSLGSCFGSTGPSSLMPGTVDQPYGMRFPMLEVNDMVRSQMNLLDHLGIDKVYASVGASMGGFLSLCAAAEFPERVGKVVTISSSARAHPTAIAFRYIQRHIIMSDPDWNEGDYYFGNFPVVGVKHARAVASVSYRSGPEWESRFGNRRRNNAPATDKPSFCQDFEVESYIDYQSEQAMLRMDPNSVLYLSKASDLWDISKKCDSFEEGMGLIKCPVLVMGVTSDILMPVSQQREISGVLAKLGKVPVTYHELDAIYGHDSFLIDFRNFGPKMKAFIES
eukprot:Nk52_evm3s393 gene=Nk52_evmTU3s393